MTPRDAARPTEIGSKGDQMRRSLLLSFAAFLLLSLGLAASASADPIKSPRVSGTATLVCGDVTYTVVSPPGPTPVGQMVTANGSNSTRVQIMILDKASAFPQDMLTQCTFTSPEVFTVDLLITPIG
jgi:hypothetical protein